MPFLRGFTKSESSSRVSDVHEYQLVALCLPRLLAIDSIDDSIMTLHLKNVRHPSLCASEFAFEVTSN